MCYCLKVDSQAIYDQLRSELPSYTWWWIGGSRVRWNWPNGKETFTLVWSINTLISDQSMRLTECVVDSLRLRLTTKHRHTSCYKNQIFLSLLLFPGKEMLYTNWGPNQPSSETSSCVVISHGDNWEDKRCSRAYGFICENGKTSCTVSCEISTGNNYCVCMCARVCVCACLLACRYTWLSEKIV